MKVVCINSFLLPKLNTGRHSHLTVGKVYDVLKISHYNEYGFMVDYVTNEINYTIINDLGYEYRFSNNLFITLEEHRNNKLKEILT